MYVASGRGPIPQDENSGLPHPFPVNGLSDKGTLLTFILPSVRGKGYNFSSHFSLQLQMLGS